MRVLLKSVPLVFALGVVAGAQMANIAEQDPINYSKSSPADSVAQLQQKIDSGAVTLEFDAQHGWLPSVLKALHVPVSSQGLVFSRTSLQVDRIAPWTPRAIYFNDDVYVGWVQGGPIMEIASADPQLGGVFYTLSQEKSDHPKFERQTHTCLQCHDSSSSTGGVPGFIMRSVVTDRYGYPVASDLGATTDATPMEKRWGGWYVTGTMGDPPHMGNVFVPKLAHEIGNVQSYLSQNKVVSAHDVTSLKDRFDVDPYLAPDSDAVALLVLAHQTYVHNLITRAGYEARISGEQLDPRAKGAAERLVSGLVMAKQAPLPAPAKGTSKFAEEFQAMGPKDGQGRSLRDLDLKARVFKYPLSYLIYSDSFNALPQVVKSYVYDRLKTECPPDVLQILRDTKPDFPKS
ncbi:MAG TPA: hypothetical protein VFA59_22515 [Vicinamibacterales bacterium]|nr:hypothetical protein [Vicinamibacterales bacterium]